MHRCIFRSGFCNLRARAGFRRSVLILLPVLLQCGESFPDIFGPLPLRIDAEIAFPAIDSFRIKKHALAGESPIEKCERILRRFR